MKKPSLALIRDQIKRSFITTARGRGFTFTPQQVCARGVNQMVILKMAGVD